MPSPHAFHHGLLALLVMSSVSPSAQAPKMKLGQVLRLTPSTTAEGSGAREYRFQADRGSRKGQYLRVSTGDAKDPPATAQATSEYQLLGGLAAADPLP